MEQKLGRWRKSGDGGKGERRNCGVRGAWGTPGDTSHLPGRTTVFTPKGTLVLPRLSCFAVPSGFWSTPAHSGTHSSGFTWQARVPPPPPYPPKSPCELDLSDFPPAARDQLPVQEGGWGEVSPTGANSACGGLFKRS